jgi:hypothetical protein
MCHIGFREFEDMPCLLRNNLQARQSTPWPLPQLCDEGPYGCDVQNLVVRGSARGPWLPRRDFVAVPVLSLRAP